MGIEQQVSIIIPSLSPDDKLLSLLGDLREAGFSHIVVVNDGKLPYQGTPQEVFRHGQELEDMGLGVPQMTRVFHRLKAMGVDIDPSVYTIEQAKQAILKAKGVG